MNYDELKKKINASIECKELREYLLQCLENECKLNYLSSSSSFLIEKASQRFKNKIKVCQQIEIDLPKELLSDGDYRLLSEKLDGLRLNLSLLYGNDNEVEITNEKSNYNQVKNLILKILSLEKIQLKLLYVDLIIKLLEEIKLDSKFNKEFIGALDLINLFVNELNFLPNEENLKYVSNLRYETNGEAIRKSFYKIIRELNKKLLFQDLLKQLLEIIENQNNLLFIQFNIIFITQCLNDPQMDADDLNKIISLVCNALGDYNELIMKKKSHTTFSKVFNQLIDLNEFKKDFKEKTGLSIISISANQSAWDEGYSEAHKFAEYFSKHVDSEKIKSKLFKAQTNYNQILEKTSIIDRFSFKHALERFRKAHRKTNEIIANTKDLAADAIEKLEEFTGASPEQLKSLFQKNSDTFSEQEKDQNTQLIQAKAKILIIKEKLNMWNSVLGLNSDLNRPNLHNQPTTNPFGISKCQELIDEFDVYSNSKFKQLLLEVISHLKKILWFEKSETNESSWFNKIFRRGYISSNFTIKKVKTYLNKDLDFDAVNNFILNKGFWRLLSYGIIRWPWMNKKTFANTWAEQLYSFVVIIQIEKLKKEPSIEHDKEILEKLIEISEKILTTPNKEPYLLNNFKLDLVAILEKIEILEQEINEYLNKKETSLFASLPIIRLFKTNGNCNFSSTEQKSFLETFKQTLRV